MSERQKIKKAIAGTISYDSMLSGVAGLLDEARRTSARAVNSIMTATYWEIGRRIVEYEQQGKRRAQYGAQLLERLSHDLISRFGRGFSVINLRTMRRFYECWPDVLIRQTASVEFRSSENMPEEPKRMSEKFPLAGIAARFPLFWSHYVRLISVKNLDARNFYEAEA